jgi:hypothetical protein
VSDADATSRLSALAQDLLGPLRGLSWLQRALVAGAVIAVLWMETTKPGLNQRLLRDGFLFGVLPLVLGLTHGRRIGWVVDKRAVKNAVQLALFVAPFYVVGSSLPTIRAYYPMWYTTADPGVFLPHALKLFTIALATETYYRGLLCVSVSDELGWKAAFISPVLYALHHIHKPPIELALAGPTDVLFGLVDYRAQSILPSVVAHGCGLVLLDWLVLHDPIVPTETVLSWLDWVPLVPL